jgi:D-sedoheptulose 7-phosphate isomerase
MVPGMPLAPSVSASFSAAYGKNLIETIQTIDAAKVTEAIDWLRDARDKGKAIFVAGNGGSAATASHFVCDMLKGASLGRPSRFRIQALHDSMPTLTAYANDLHYQDAAVEQLKNFASSGDIYMAISGSGNSPNVIRAMEYANSAGCRTIALTGRDGGKLGPLAHLNIQVPEQHMGRIEDAHHIICHMMCYSFIDSD